VRASLVVRIGLAAVAVALLVAVATWFALRDSYGTDVTSLAHRQVARFNHQSGYLLDGTELPEAATLQREIEAFAAGQPDHPWGRFVQVAIYDPDLRRLVLLLDDDAPELDLRAHSAEPIDLAAGGVAEGSFEIVRVEGRPHIVVVQPLRNSRGEHVGWIEGVFALSDTTVAAARWRIARSVMWVIGVVFLTALVLYPIIRELMRRLMRFSSDLLEANLETLKVVGSAVAKRDNETQAHSARVTLTAVRLAEHMGLDRHEIQRLVKGALLHDVGKVAIRDEILLKPGRLTDEEFEIMRTHVAHGAQIVHDSAWLAGSEDVVRYHHERFDGSGYLAGLKATEIPRLARIFAIADVFDAVTSKRPYKEAIPLERTMEILEAGAGSHFDPDMVAAFAEIADEVYREIAGRTNEELDMALGEVLERYFSGGMEALQP
jgi:putative nucleotidyltransferase with HDIG domain